MLPDQVETWAYPIGSILAAPSILA